MRTYEDNLNDLDIKKDECNGTFEV